MVVAWSQQLLLAPTDITIVVGRAVLCCAVLQISEARSAAREAELKLLAAESRANKVSLLHCAHGHTGPS